MFGELFYYNESRNGTMQMWPTFVQGLLHADVPIIKFPVFVIVCRYIYIEPFEIDKVKCKKKL